MNWRRFNNLIIALVVAVWLAGSGRAVAVPITLLYEDFSSDPGWARVTNSLSPVGGWYYSTIPPAFISAPPQGRAAYVNEALANDDGSFDVLYLPSLDTRGLETLHLRFQTYAPLAEPPGLSLQDYFVDIEGDSPYFLGDPLGREEIRLPEQDAWVLIDLDISQHVGASALEVSFRTTDLGTWGSGQGLDQVEVYGEPTPEPSSFLLLGLGLLRVGYLKRKRSNRTGGK